MKFMIYTFINIVKYELMLMSPILIHDHMDHSSLLPLLVCNLLLQHWETLFPPPTTYLPDLVNSSIESELLTVPLWEETY